MVTQIIDRLAITIERQEARLSLHPDELKDIGKSEVFQCAR